MKEIFAKLVAKEDLSAEEMTAVAEKLFQGSCQTLRRQRSCWG